MNTHDKEDLKNMENSENRNMDEKVHYEIKFVETEDGYRLEATGDKKALRKLGIGPNMVGRKRGGRHRSRQDWARARHARKVGSRQSRRATMMARRAEEMRGPYRFTQSPESNSFDFASGPRRGSRRLHGRCGGHGRRKGMRGSGRFEKGPESEEFGLARGPRRGSRRLHGRPHGKSRPDFGQLTWEW